MKKNVRNMLIMLAVLVVLGGAAALLLLFPKSEGDGVSSQVSEVSSTISETVVDRETEEVSSISVENQNGGFVMVHRDDGFVLEGYEDCDVNTSLVSSCASSILSVSASKNLGSQENLEDFGLKGGSAVTVKIACADGSADDLVLGSGAGESAGRYVLKDDAVYIVSGISEMLDGTVFGFFNTDLYTIPDRTEGTDNGDGTTSVETVEDILYSMKLSGSNFPDPIELTYNPDRLSQYGITSPMIADSSDGRLEDIVTSLKTLSADGVEAVHLTPELLEQYGLAQPAAKVEFDLNNKEHTLTVSASSGGQRYLLLDDRDVVYRVADDAVSAWADTSLLALRSAYIWLINIMDVKNLTFTVDGDMVYSYDVTRTKNEEESTEDNISYDLTIKNAAGQDIDYENYQGLYKQLIAISVLNTNPAEYGDDPAYRVEYSYFDSAEPTVVEFFAVGEDRYAAELNGEYTGQVRKNEVDKIMSRLPSLNENKASE